MRIGNVELASNLWLSPIAGYYDLPFREEIRRLGGLGLAFSELASPRGLEKKTERSLRIVATSPLDQPLAIQLFGSDANELADAAKWAADNGAVVVDINMGCPVPKVAGKGGGSGLLRCCANAVAIADKVVRECPVPVTVKTRLGWEMGNLVAPKLARDFEAIGVAALTIHGRYGEQKFKGSVCLDGIRSVVQAVDRMPVFGNGDIRSVDDIRRMMDYTGCAGVMIGRWALADNWIFHDARQYFTTGVLPPPPTRLERIDQMMRHFERTLPFLGERLTILQFRKFMPWYCRKLGPCGWVRRAMTAVRTPDDFRALIGRFADEVRQRGDAPNVDDEEVGEELDSEPVESRTTSGACPA